MGKKKETRNCPRCGYGPLTEDDYYCPNCGLYFPEGALEEPVEGWDETAYMDEKEAE